MAKAEGDILNEYPPLIFLTGKTSSGKTYLSNRLVAKGYQLVKLDDVIFEHVIARFGISDSNVGFATYRGDAPQEWMNTFIEGSRQRILSELQKGNVVVEGALANNDMIKAIFCEELDNFIFLFLLPTDVSTYAERITKRFIFETETGKTGLPKEFYQMVSKEDVKKYISDKQIDESLKEKILRFAQWSLEESERRLDYFKSGFTDIVVVEV